MKMQILILVILVLGIYGQWEEHQNIARIATRLSIKSPVKVVSQVDRRSIIRPTVIVKLVQAAKQPIDWVEREVTRRLAERAQVKRTMRR